MLRSAARDFQRLSRIVRILSEYGFRSFVREEPEPSETSEALPASRPQRRHSARRRLKPPRVALWEIAG